MTSVAEWNTVLETPPSTSHIRAGKNGKPSKLAGPIRFVPHPDFDQHEFVHNTLEALPNFEDSQETDVRLHGQDYYLPHRPLLSAVAEQTLFLRMNLLRCLASRREERLAGSPHPEVCERTIRNLLDGADTTRNEIMEANQRLVISNASKFSRNGVALADLVSEGNLALIKAIDGFDVTRGFRFSTYATHAIRRHLSRYVQRIQQRTPMVCEDRIEPQIEDTPAEWLDQHPAELIRDILDNLTPRESEMLKMRFGLNPDGNPSTLEVIGQRFGVSSERARQLIIRACVDAYVKHAYRLGIE